MVEIIVRLTGMQSAETKVGRCLVFGDRNAVVLNVRRVCKSGEDFAL